MRLKIFKTHEEGQSEKWEQMAKQTVNERLATLLYLQRLVYPETFDPETGKRKPLEHRIILKKPFSKD